MTILVMQKRTQALKQQGTKTNGGIGYQNDNFGAKTNLACRNMQNGPGTQTHDNFGYAKTYPST